MRKPIVEPKKKPNPKEFRIYINGNQWFSTRADVASIHLTVPKSDRAYICMSQKELNHRDERVAHPEIHLMTNKEYEAWLDKK